MELDIKALYSAHGPMVLRRCRFLLRDEDLAFDAMQDVFMKLVERQDELTEVCSSFLYKTATTVCLNRIRSEKLRRTHDFDEQLCEIAGFGSNHEEHTIASMLLDSVFDSMKENTRYLAVLYYIDRLTLEETARETGMSVSGVRKRLAALRKRLQLMEDEGGVQ
ncbi:MAG: sigma-70 family RNA polymerase sigma factor [Spirochaetaceae bacterium]|jgi:RNA polymerase sigma-70 factor (ECF subfamily)|nr:sigma-70 family RNA polymerase sigma factor [Spirochaetaceae bacterium]